MVNQDAFSTVVKTGSEKGNDVFGGYGGASGIRGKTVAYTPGAGGVSS